VWTQVIIHMQMGGMPHDRIMESIELIGKELIRLPMTRPSSERSATGVAVITGGCQRNRPGVRPRVRRDGRARRDRRHRRVSDGACACAPVGRGRDGRLVSAWTCRTPRRSPTSARLPAGSDPWPRYAERCVTSAGSTVWETADATYDFVVGCESARTVSQHQDLRSEARRARQRAAPRESPRRWAGMVASPYSAVYAASKAGAIALAKSFARRVGDGWPRRSGVALLNPGMVKDQPDSDLCGPAA